MQAMLAHRPVSSTNRWGAKNDPTGGVPKVLASLRDACDSPTSQRDPRLTSILGTPSCDAFACESRC